MTNIFKRWVVGGPVGVFTRIGNKVDVALQDQTTRNFAWRFKRLLNLVTLATDGTLGAYTLTLVSGHSFTTADHIAILEDGIPYQAGVVDVTGDVITLDTPIPHAFTTAATAARTNVECNVDGSGAPVMFNINPTGRAVWDITHVIFTIIGTGAMDDSLFGDQAALANGIVLRKLESATEYRNIFNAKTNGDFREMFGRAEYTTKVGGGEFSFVSDHQFGAQDGFGTVIRLSGPLAQELQILIQDDLTALTKYHVTAIGHEVQD
jgi:hypothetical protein